MGHKFGEFAPTRNFRHIAKKDSENNEAVAN